MLTVVPFEDCQVVSDVSGWFIAFALPLNTMLFLLRIIAIFRESKLVIGIFTFIWLGTFSSFLAPFVFTAGHIGSTSQCLVEKVTSASSSWVIAITVYDTLVFAAITLRILFDHPVMGWKDRTRLCFSGQEMGHIYRMLLQTGQMYYL